MAINYDVKIKEIENKPETYSINTTVTDDSKAIGYQVEKVAIISARMDDEAQKKELWDNIKAHYLIAAAKIDFIVTAQAEAKAYLEKP